MLLLSEWKGCCALSRPRLQDPFMICGSCHEGGAAPRTGTGGGARASLAVPERRLPGFCGSNFLCNPTPLVVLILGNKREAELFKFKWGFPFVEVLLTLRAKMGSTWGHRWVEAFCAAWSYSLVLLQLLWTSVGRIVVMSWHWQTLRRAQITSEGVLYVFSTCKCLFNYVN